VRGSDAAGQFPRGIQDVRALRAMPPAEYSSADAEWLGREFGQSSDKRTSLREHLRGANRVLVFSESNSIMLVYVDEESKAFRAECFLQ